MGVIAGPRRSVELARETASAWHGDLPGETIMNVDTEDLIDAAGVAQLLGLARRTSVSVYQQRYPDMPRPIVDLGAGRSRLWSRRAILSWLATADRRKPQDIVKPELKALTLIGERYARGIFRSMYSTARQHGLGRGKQRRELPPTRRAA